MASGRQRMARRHLASRAQARRSTNPEIGGTAREVVRDMPVNLLTHGVVDPVTERQVVAAPYYILETLQARFGAYAVETPCTLR